MIEYLLTAFFVTSPVGPSSVEGAQAPAARKAEEARPGGPVEITSKRVTGSRTQAVFTGDVVLKQRTLDLRCDELTAYYTGPREVTRAECVGNVRAAEGDRTARGERADLDVPGGSVVVTGNPEAGERTHHRKGSLVRLRTGTQGPGVEVENAVVTVEGAPLKPVRKEGPAAATALNNPVEITSKRLAGSRTQAVFSGDVEVKQRTLDLRCDKMTAFYNTARQVSRVECAGNVRAVDGERTARGERADFNVPTGVLVVTGNPEARDPTTHLRGSEVRMTVGNSNFEVKDAVITLESASPPPGAAGRGGPAGTQGSTPPGRTKTP